MHVHNLEPQLLSVGSIVTTLTSVPLEVLSIRKYRNFTALTLLEIINVPCKKDVEPEYALHTLTLRS